MIDLRIMKASYSGYLKHSVKKFGREIYNNFDIDQLKFRCLNTLFSSLQYRSDSEFELNSLDIFIDKFQQPADIKVISIGSFDIKEEQIYPFLYETANHQLIHIHLFDPSFYVKNFDNFSDSNSYQAGFTKPPKCFLTDELGTWKKIDVNSFTHTNLNITVSIYKCFPEWGVKTFGEYWRRNFLEPLITETISNEEKVIIGQHTGGAWISPGLIESFCRIADEAPEYIRNLILFGGKYCSTDYISYFDADDRILITDDEAANKLRQKLIDLNLTTNYKINDCSTTIRTPQLCGEDYDIASNKFLNYLDDVSTLGDSDFSTTD